MKDKIPTKPQKTAILAAICKVTHGTVGFLVLDNANHDKLNANVVGMNIEVEAIEDMVAMISDDILDTVEETVDVDK